MTAVRDQLRRAIKRPGADATYADVGDEAWLDLDWARMRRHHVVRGRRLNVVDSQTGDDPLVFVHGLGGTWQNWLLNIPNAIERGHRVVALDLPGFGDSEMPFDRISISGYAQVVDALLADLGVERATVVGNSMGGFIGAEMAVACPRRVERLVLVSPAILTSEHARREPLLAAARASTLTTRFVVSNVDLAVKRPRLRRATLGGIIRYPELLSTRMTWELLQGTGRPGFVHALDAILSYPFRERLPDIACPTLVVWGREDMLVPSEDADELGRLIKPCSRVEVFDDTGHMPMLERPSRFHALLDAFMTGDPAPESGVAGVDARSVSA